MSTVDQWMAEPPRNGRGQYLMADEDGNVKGRTRATTHAKAASDETNLTNWKLRTVVRGLALRPDLHGMAVAAGESRELLTEVADQAFQAAAGDAKANNGTALHGICAAIAAGKMQLNYVPPALQPDVSAYFRELARQGITEHAGLMERSVFVKAYNVGGTLDRIYTWLPCPVCGKTEYIGDIKTGRDLSYSEHEIAVQLADYANADQMFLPGSAEQFDPMPDVCKHTAIVLHVPQGTGTAFAERIDIQAGWWAARLCHEVRQWRSFKGLRTPLIPSPTQIIQGLPTGQTSPVTTVMVSDPFAGIPQPPESEVYVPDGTPGSEWGPMPAQADVPDDQAQVEASAAPLIPPGSVVGSVVPAMNEEYDAMADQLFEAIKKSKPKLQAMARDLMSIDTSVPIKLTQYAIKIANEIVRHPAWAEHSDALIAKYIPQDRRPAAPKSEPQKAVERVQAITITGQTDITAEEVPLGVRLDAHADAQAERIQARIDNPFDVPAPAAPAFNEAYYLSAIASADSKRALAQLWQHASDNGVEWTAALNAAGMTRMNEIAAQLGNT